MDRLDSHLLEDLNGMVESTRILIDDFLHVSVIVTHLKVNLGGWVFLFDELFDLFEFLFLSFELGFVVVSDDVVELGFGNVSGEGTAVVEAIVSIGILRTGFLAKHRIEEDA